MVKGHEDPPAFGNIHQQPDGADVLLREFSLVPYRCLIPPHQVAGYGTCRVQEKSELDRVFVRCAYEPKLGN